MYVISKEFHFSASHRLASLPPGHQCARMHGHNYQVVLELRCDDTELTEPDSSVTSVNSTSSRSGSTPPSTTATSTTPSRG